MIRRLFPHPPRGHRIGRTCDNPALWLTARGGITCYCKEAKQ